MLTASQTSSAAAGLGYDAVWRSALFYKYDPSVRYSVELYRGSSGDRELRVSLRRKLAAVL
jgi:hypothetical protein